MKPGLPATLVLFLTVMSAAPAVAEPDYTRTPVLLVHGYFPIGGATWVTWTTFKNKLVEDGWPEEYVMARQFKDTTGCDPDHAREISAWVDELRASTGFDRINIVAHSEGGLNTMYYLRYFCGVNKVANFVGLAIAVHGTTVACWDLLSCGADEMCIGEGTDSWKENATLAAVNACDETPGDVKYTSIWSNYDEIIKPQEGSRLAGAWNVELKTVGVEHGLIFVVDESFNYMKDALLNGTGLNTDGPGWDCIGQCRPPDVADTAETTDAPETAEIPALGEPVPETAEATANDVVEPGDTTAGDAVDYDVPDGYIVVPYDAGTRPLDTSSGRDQTTGADGTADVTIADVGRVDDDAVTPAKSSNGCTAGGRGGAGPMAAAGLLALFMLALAGLRRITARD